MGIFNEFERNIQPASTFAHDSMDAAWSFPDSENSGGSSDWIRYFGSLALDVSERLVFDTDVRFFYVDPINKPGAFARHPVFRALDADIGVVIAQKQIEQDYLVDSIFGPPAIGADGEFFVTGLEQVLGPVLFALRYDEAEGALVSTWQHEVRKGPLYCHNAGVSSPVIGPEGVVYFSYSSCEDPIAAEAYVLAVDPSNGEVLWRKLLPQNNGAHPVWNPTASTPAIDAAGTVYVGSESGLWALSPETGEAIGLFETPTPINSSPVLDGNGVIYVGDDSGTLYAFQGSPDGPADSPWPMFGHDARHTGATDWPEIEVVPAGTLDFGTISSGSGSSEVVVLRDLEKIKIQALLVYGSVFFVAPRVTYNEYAPLGAP